MAATATGSTFADRRRRVLVLRASYGKDQYQLLAWAFPATVVWLIRDNIDVNGGWSDIEALMRVTLSALLTLSRLEFLLVIANVDL
jgi:hypothetical protein